MKKALKSVDIMLCDIVSYHCQKGGQFATYTSQLCVSVPRLQ